MNIEIYLYFKNERALRIGAGGAKGPLRGFIDESLFGYIRTNEVKLRACVVESLLAGLISLKYTQSNSINVS